MNALLVDTSSWISYFLSGRESKLMDSAMRNGVLYTSPVIVAELLSGELSKKHRRDLQSMLMDLPLCDADLLHFIRVGSLRADLRSKGFSVSIPDTHVAQSALDLGAHLLTEDHIFQHIAKIYPLSLVDSTLS